MTLSFADRWANKERELGLEEIASKIIYIGEVSLPDSAAPCLSFSQAENPVAIHSIFGFKANWTEAEREQLKPFIVIGSDASGSPICVTGESGKVYLLNHENLFESPQFVNSSLNQLAECLLAYQGETSAEFFQSLVNTIDSAALAKGSFWEQEALLLKGVSI